MQSIALLYHRINTLKPDPWNTCVSPSHFAEHLEVLRSFRTSVNVTFDDGYADNLQNALPLLEKYDVPAIVFITSGAVGCQHEMWWDELARKHLALTDLNWDWDDQEVSAGSTLYRQSFNRYHKAPFPIFSSRPPARSGYRMLTVNELDQLSSSKLITIGAHTVSHPVLSNLTMAEQKWEIETSKYQLESLLDCKIDFFAYPNGGRNHFSEQTAQLTKAAGFQKAYAAFDGVIDSQTDLFQLPRVMVRDWDGEMFASVVKSKLSL